MRETDWTKVLGWPGYRVYRHEIEETAKTLKLWVRGERGNRKLVCSGCGRKLADAYDTYEREVRDLPCFEFRTTVVVELYRVRCPDCGVKTEKVPQLPSKAPFSKRFEEAVGLACESAAVRRVARQFGLASSTVRAIDLRYLRRWAEGRRKPALTYQIADVSRGSCRLCHDPEMVRRDFPVLQRVVSRSAYPGGARPIANRRLIGGLSKYF